MKCSISKQGGWCGYCYAIKRGRASLHGPSMPRYTLACYIEDVMKFLQRVVKPSNPALAERPQDGGAWANLYPALVEFLTITRWDEKTPRTTGTIMLMQDEGRWKAWVHDRDAKRSMFVTGMTPDGVIANVEELLANNGGEWRFDRK